MAWTNDENKSTESLPLQSVREINFGFYHFRLKETNEFQDRVIISTLNQISREKVVKLASFANLLNKLGVDYILTFAPVPALTQEENMTQYATEFLPFLRELIDRKLYTLPTTEEKETNKPC